MQTFELLSRRLMIFALIWLTVSAIFARPVSDGAFLLESNPEGAISSLKRRGDPDGIEFLRNRATLGNLHVRFRIVGGEWREGLRHNPELQVSSSFTPTSDSAIWDIAVTNATSTALEVGDLALPLPMNTDYVWNDEETFVRRVFRHGYIAGHGSWIYWLPVKGTGTFLVLTPRGNSHLEFFTAEGMDYAYGREQFTAYIHSRCYAEQHPSGSWRQPHTSVLLKPGEGIKHQFCLNFVDSYEGVRSLLAGGNGIDVQVIPGMVIPRDLHVLFKLNSKHPIHQVEPEYPDETAVARVGKGKTGGTTFKVKFSRLGENRLIVHYGPDRKMPMEFFVTEPLELLIQKRARFISRKQQHRDPNKWYDGLFSLWNRNQPEGRNLLGPDHPGGQHAYAVSGSDDPSNGKCLLLAEKNIAFPEQAEIASLEYFVRNFVWGKHQRTAEEKPYPYGIYGADSWKQNRFATRDPIEGGISRPGGPSACRMWRTFDYPTYFALYYNLYVIAKQNPGFVKELSAEDYLERAYGTARAYFEVPASIRMEGGWSFTGWVYWQYTVGNFHEKYLLPLISALEREGHVTKADYLRAEWEKKVKYFIYDNEWPFASEMPIDSTAYESTYAAARYALTHRLSPDTNLWHDRNLNKSYSHAVIDLHRHRQFLGRQHWANLACRGVLAPNYWSLGSDFRGCGAGSYTLSYMSQMGGWAVLDYALRFDAAPAFNLRLGYASMLSTWALMNSGDAESDYGYWTPGPLHDGAMSWGFQPRKTGTEWNPATRDLPRGAWPVCGEADHGLVAAIESARTVVFEDPDFGLFAFGGELVKGGNTLAVVPRDGVRQRVSFLVGTNRIHLDLDRDGFVREKPIRVSSSLKKMSFAVESRSRDDHETTLRVDGIVPGIYAVRAGSLESVVTVRSGHVLPIVLKVPGGGCLPVQIERIRSRPIRN